MPVSLQVLSTTDSLPVPAVAETPTMLLVWALENAWVTSVESNPRMGAGENVDGLNVDGENVDGLNVDGENVDGENVDGLNVDGLNVDGENVDGLNVDGENVDGLYASGLNVDGLNVDGLNVDGAYSAAYLREVKTVLETRDWTQALNA